MKHSLQPHWPVTSFRGFTLLEVLMVMVIMGVLLALVTPSIKSMMDKQRVRGTCESVYQNLALARSSAISLNKNVTFNLRNPGSTWCVGLYDASVTTGCDCSTSPGACTVGGLPRSASYDDFAGSAINVTVAGGSTIVFDARDATPDTTTVVTVASTSWTCKLGLEALGQVRYYKVGSGNNTRSIVPLAESGGLY